MFITFFILVFFTLIIGLFFIFTRGASLIRNFIVTYQASSEFVLSNLLPIFFVLSRAVFNPEHIDLLPLILDQNGVPMVAEVAGAPNQEVANAANAANQEART